ncbi:peptidoglycan-binding protein [Sulfitobacter sp. JB4-11]|uniref:peptidoglycan-binding protein n=1 Tax=Sulfitobacter rhodophyticola TaxID=3238304 RepID=UPI0035190ACF
MTKAPPFSMRRSAVMLAACAGVLAGCESVPQAADAPEPGVLAATRSGPEGAAPGTCWGRTVSPAVVERVREQVQVSPAEVNPDGTIAKLPVFRNEVREQIVTPRRDNWFETPCPEVLTPAFNESLQRALAARGYYIGPITGEMDSATRAAVQRLQATQGLESGVLSLAMAQQLGLIVVDLPPAATE